MSSELKSSLFNNPGYIPIKEYISSIDIERVHSNWKFPLTVLERFHFFILKVVLRFSWFSGSLYVEHGQTISPMYNFLLSYLKKHEILDSFTERDLHCKGYYSYYIEKQYKTKEGKFFLVSGQGVSKDRSTALSIAIGEIIERTITGLYDENKKITEASPEELMKTSRAVYPPLYHRFLDSQKKKFKILHSEPNKKIRWVAGENMITKEKVYIPRRMTSWFNERVNSHDNIMVHGTTNGSAGFFSKDEAVLRGLLEVIQRDGFLVHWLTQIKPEIIPNNTLPKHLEEKVAAFEERGMSISIVNVTSFSIPTVVVAVISRNAEVPQVVVSGASSFTFDEAIDAALKEVVIGTEMFYYQKKDTDIVPATHEPFISSLDKIPRQLYWRGVDKIKKFEWFISGKTVSYSEISKRNLHVKDTVSEKLQIVLRLLKGYGAEYYPVVYYPENRIQKKIGFYVAQVYIPKAFPFYLFEGYGTFDSDRLDDFAKSKNITNWALNPEPHMFS